MKKLFALALCILFVFAAGAASAAEIPKDQFISRADLMALSARTNDGSGLLATGTNTDVKLRINFGARPEAVAYNGLNSTNTAEEGSVTWLLAGAENGNLVLYSEEPLLGNGTPFAADTTDRTYNDGTGEQTVHANHWGASDLRASLNAALDTHFAAFEREIMETTAIETMSYKASSTSYVTMDVLYAPSGDYYDDQFITVGEADGLKIDVSHWKARHWLRSPYEDSSGYVLVIYPGFYIYDSNVIYPTVAASAAFSLNAERALFASAASAAADGYIPSGTPMTLRLQSPESLGDALVSTDGTTVSVNNAEGARLMVQGVDQSGKSWNWSQAITGPQVISAADILPDINLHDCKVWLEKDMPNGGSLTYAQMAQIGDTGNGASGANGGEDIPETGDNSRLLQWTLMLVSSAACIIAMAKKRKA